MQVKKKMCGIAQKFTSVLNHLNITLFPGTAMCSSNADAVEWKLEINLCKNYIERIGKSVFIFVGVYVLSSDP